MNLTKIIPADIMDIFSIFRSYQDDSIRLVGGCVRDIIFGKKVSDYDFASIYTPIELIEIANQNNIKAIPTGIDYGTITIIYKSKSFEITTLRNDYDYDGRKPIVTFGTNYYEDSKRRDFTINALYIDQNLEIIDYHNGINDIRNKKLTFIGDPKQRIKEDNLRILRYFRFLSMFNEQIDQESLNQSINNIDLVQTLSQERIYNEVIKMFCYSTTEVLKSLEIIKKFNIDKNIFCSSINLHKLNNIKKLEQSNIEIDQFIKLYSIFNNDQMISFIKKYKFPKIYQKYFNSIQEISLNLNKENINYLIYKHSKKYVIDSLILSSCQENTLNVDFVINKIADINSREIPNFPIKGTDIIEIGVKQGPAVGIIFDHLLKIWCQSDFTKTKENLIINAKKLK